MDNVLPITPNFMTETAIKEDLDSVEFGGRRKQYFAVPGGQYEAYTLRFEHIDRAEKEALVEFWKDHRGPAIQWSFFNYVTDTWSQVRFVGDSLRVEHVNAYLFDIEVQIETA